MSEKTRTRRISRSALNSLAAIAMAKGGRLTVDLEARTASIVFPAPGETFAPANDEALEIEARMKAEMGGAR